MNKATITRILNKGKLTGHELGNLILLNTVEEERSFRKTGKKTSLFTENDLRMAERSLTDYGRKVYGGYLGLHNIIMVYFNLLQGQQQQFLHSFYRLLVGLIGLSYNIENALNKKETPCIMTLKTFKKKDIEADKEAKACKESYIGLFRDVLKQYTELLEKNPDAKTPITKIYKDYLNKPAEDKELIEKYRAYNSDYYRDCVEPEDNVYYIMTDKRTSKEVTVREYIDDLLTRPLFKELGDIEKIKERYFNPYSIADNLRMTNPEALKDVNMNDLIYSPDAPAKPFKIYNFFTDLQHYLIAQDKEDLADKVADLERELFIIEETPTKADFLLYWGFIDYYVMDFEDGWDKEAEKDNLRLFNLYLKELPELAEVITKELLNTKGLEDLKKVKPEDYAKPVISWSVLMRDNLFDYRERAKDFLYSDYPNGIAIIQEDSITDYTLKNSYPEGIYKDSFKKTELPNRISELINLFCKSDLLDAEENIVQKELLLPSLKFIYAINSFLEDIEKIYKLEGLKEIYGLETNSIEHKVTVLNYYKSVIEDQITSYAGWDTKEGIKFREVLNTNYKLIDIKACQPTEENKKNAQAYISDIEVFRDSGTSNLFYRLYMPDTKEAIREV